MLKDCHFDWALGISRSSGIPEGVFYVMPQLLSGRILHTLHVFLALIGAKGEAISDPPSVTLVIKVENSIFIFLFKSIIGAQVLLEPYSRSLKSLSCILM